MELRRILMGLYLLAFPAMMWGQTPVVPGTTDEEHSGHRKETPVNFGFKGGFATSCNRKYPTTSTGATPPSRNLCPKTPHQEPGRRKPPLHRPSTV